MMTLAAAAVDRYPACRRVHFVISVVISEKLSLWVRNRPTFKDAADHNKIQARDCS